MLCHFIHSRVTFCIVSFSVNTDGAGAFHVFNKDERGM